MVCYGQAACDMHGGRIGTSEQSVLSAGIITSPFRHRVYQAMIEATAESTSIRDWTPGPAACGNGAQRPEPRAEP